MKTISNILILTAIMAFASCARGFIATSTEYDDVYYVPGKKSEIASSTNQAISSANEIATTESNKKSTAIPYDSYEGGISDYERYRQQKEQEMLTDQQPVYRSETEDNYDTSVVYEDENMQDYSKSYSYYDKDTDRVVINNYYGSDYYDDYYYSSRIRRFSYPYYSWNYYDPFFTDMFYYNYNPAYWGMNIYYGSYFSPYFGFSYSPWYYGRYYPYYSSFFYDPWYSPYYSSFYRGYYTGLYDSYYGYGYYPYYYPYTTIREGETGQLLLRGTELKIWLLDILINNKYFRR